MDDYPFGRPARKPLMYRLWLHVEGLLDTGTRDDAHAGPRIRAYRAMYQQCGEPCGGTDSDMARWFRQQAGLSN